MKSIGMGCTTFFCTLALACASAAEQVAAEEVNEQDGVSASSAQAEQKQPEYSMSVEAPLVVVDVLVTDEDGNVLTGLKKGNFRVLDNGKPQCRPAGRAVCLERRVRPYRIHSLLRQGCNARRLHQRGKLVSDASCLLSANGRNAKSRFCRRSQT